MNSPFCTVQIVTENHRQSKLFGTVSLLLQLQTTLLYTTLDFTTLHYTRHGKSEKKVLRAAIVKPEISAKKHVNKIMKNHAYIVFTAFCVPGFP